MHSCPCTAPARVVNPCRPVAGRRKVRPWCGVLPHLRRRPARVLLQQRVLRHQPSLLHPRAVPAEVWPLRQARRTCHRTCGRAFWRAFWRAYARAMSAGKERQRAGYKACDAFIVAGPFHRHVRLDPANINTVINSATQRICALCVCVPCMPWASVQFDPMNVNDISWLCLHIL